MGLFILFDSITKTEKYVDLTTQNEQFAKKTYNKHFKVHIIKKSN